MPWLKFDEKQWEEIKQEFDRVVNPHTKDFGVGVNVAKEIATEQ